MAIGIIDSGLAAEETLDIVAKGGRLLWVHAMVSIF